MTGSLTTIISTIQVLWFICEKRAGCFLRLMFRGLRTEFNDYPSQPIHLVSDVSILTPAPGLLHSLDRKLSERSTALLLTHLSPRITRPLSSLHGYTCRSRQAKMQFARARTLCPSLLSCAFTSTNRALQDNSTRWRLSSKYNSDESRSCLALSNLTTKPS